MKPDQRNLILAILGAFAAIVLMPVMAQAQCTTAYTGSGSVTAGITTVAVNMVDIIISQISSLLGDVAEDMYNTIINSTAYKVTLGAVLVLYFSVYGTMLALGMVNTSPNEVLTRFFKVGVIFALLTPGSWAFFSEYIYGFFFNGMLEIIQQFNAIGGLDTGGDGSEIIGNVVSSVLGPIIAAFLSQTAIVTVTNIWFVLPMGPFVGFFLVWGLVMLLIAVITALATFIKSMVGLFFLFGLAPLFIICLLFERTKSIFQGWLNQVISFTLQPIFVFAFLGFFVALIFTSMLNMLSVRWCVESLGSILPGLAFEPYQPTWVPAHAGCGGAPSEVTGPWTFGGTCETTGTKIGFPISLADLFIFVVLSYLAWKYCGYVSMIAQQLSGAMASGMANPAAMGSWMGRAMGGGALGVGLGATGLGAWAANKARGSAADNTESESVPRAETAQNRTTTANTGQTPPENATATSQPATTARQADPLASNSQRMYESRINQEYDAIGEQWKNRYGVELDHTGLGMAHSHETIANKLDNMDPSDSRYEILERRRELLNRQLDYYRTPRDGSGNET